MSKGDVAPPFSLKDQDGKVVSLSKFKGKPVVLYFYPADETPGCTKQVTLSLSLSNKWSVCYDCKLYKHFEVAIIWLRINACKVISKDIDVTQCYVCPSVALWCYILVLGQFQPPVNINKYSFLSCIDLISP